MSREALVHPAVWYGDELATRQDWLRSLPLEHGALSDDFFASAAPTLQRIQHELEAGSGACLIRGMPVHEMNEEEASGFFLKLSSLVGTPVPQSAAGERVFSVRDAGLAPEDPRARGPNTRKKLTFHTDRCDVIGFLCLQQAKSGGENDIVSSLTLYNEILARRPDLLEVLFEPFHVARHNVDVGKQKPWCEQPVFSVCQGHFAAALMRVLIDRAAAMPELPDLSDAQREALDLVQSLAEDPGISYRFRQEPGDLLFLNNWVTLHRRTAFEDHELPAEKRHLLRIWLSMPNSRPLDPRYVDTYGATDAGAIRGGMHARS